MPKDAPGDPEDGQYVGATSDVDPRAVRYLGDLIGAAFARYLRWTATPAARTAHATAARTATSGRQTRQGHTALEAGAKAWALATSATLAVTVNLALALWGSPLRFDGFVEPSGSEPDLWAQFHCVGTPDVPRYLAIDIKGCSRPETAGRVASESNVSALACTGGRPAGLEVARARLDAGYVGHGYLVVVFEFPRESAGGGAVRVHAYNLLFAAPSAWRWGMGQYPLLQGAHGPLARSARTSLLFDSMWDTGYAFLTLLAGREEEWAQARAAKASERRAAVAAGPAGRRPPMAVAG